MTSDPDRKSSPATEFTKFDASDYLDSEEAIAEFLNRTGFAGGSNF